MDEHTKLKKDRILGKKRFESHVGHLDPNHFRVAIFGSARIQKNDAIYSQIKSLAAMLAQRGIDVVTGGGPGLMEAASEGHYSVKKRNGSHAIGLGIKLPKEQQFNSHLDIKKEYQRFSSRLDNFMVLSNVVVVAPGGVGTLLEFFYTWQLTQVHHICNTPIILLGKQWEPFIEWIEKYPLKTNFIDKEEMSAIFIAKDSNEAIRMIEKAYEEYKKGDQNYCLNYKKYKLY